MNIIKLLNAGSVLNQFGQVKVSSKLAYKIMKFYKCIAVEEEFYNMKRNEIIQEYAVKDENGQVIADERGMVKIAPDMVAKANAAMQELNALEVEAPNVRFTLAELEGLEVSAADMFALDDFIDEEGA